MAARDSDGMLPGAPHPWAPSTMPVLRAGPPYLMTEMIAAEPALAERLVRRLARDPALEEVAARMNEVAASTRPIVFIGCGTSEHAAMAAAEIVSEGLEAAGLPAHCHALESLESQRHLGTAGLVIAISHEGGTAATNDALRRAAEAGSTTALITVSRGSPGGHLAQVVVETGEQDRSWCHTVGYLSPVVAAAALGARLAGAGLDPVAVRALLDIGDDEQTAAEIAATVASCERVLIAGSGVDYVGARELALKIEEGARLPAVAHHLETMRHGHLAAATPRTALVVVLTSPALAPVRQRARDVLRSAAILGMPAVALLGASLGDELSLDLTPAGRLSVSETKHLAARAASVLGTAIPLQLLAERLARARGVNPDTLGREDRRHAAAADAHG